MKKKENNKLLLAQMEKHAADTDMLNQVRKVARKLKNVKIIKRKKKEYLIIEE